LLTDGYYKPDYTDFPGERRELTGDADHPGVWVLSTADIPPGTCPTVDLPHTGPWLFAADAADLAENFTDRKPPGRTVLREDWPRAIMSIERLLEEKDGRRTAHPRPRPALLGCSEASPRRLRMSRQARPA
jgi:hypothetical protein